MKHTADYWRAWPQKAKAYLRWQRGLKVNTTRWISGLKLRAEGQGGSVANLDLSVDIRQPQESMGLGTSSQAVGDTDANPAPHLGQGMAGPASVRSEPQWPLVGPGPLLPASAAAFVADPGAAEGG
jgi:hypothetical protein